MLKLTLLYFLVIIYAFVHFSISWVNENATDENLFEGDIVLDPELATELISGSEDNTNIQNSDSESSLWLNGTIPYEISNLFSKVEETLIENIMLEFHFFTCIRFRRRTVEKNYIRIVKNYDVCQSLVGFQGGMQLVGFKIECLTRNTVLHELMHVLGFWHEQSRLDRDEYIEILEDNITENGKKNFRKYRRQNVTHSYTPYDYNSVMHYDIKYFSKNGYPTIRIKRRDIVIKREGLSVIDKQKINILYNCINDDKLSNRHDGNAQTSVFGTARLSVSTQRLSTVASKSDTTNVISTIVPSTRSIGATAGICPSGWTYDDHYPHNCYKIFPDRNGTWNDARFACSQTTPGATLPIFLYESEYISYSNWWKKTSNYCYEKAWLGLIFNITSKTYYWIDGSTPKFSLISTNNLPSRDAGVYHVVSGKWSSVYFGYYLPGALICQLRQNTKCPNNMNWFYDSRSEIRYYFDQKQEALDWHSANHICVTEIGGSLPFFMTNYEWENFSHLIKASPIDCRAGYHLGYIGQKGVFKTVNGSIAPFVKWDTLITNTQKTSSSLSYVFSDGWSTYNNWKITDGSSRLHHLHSVFLCQCRSGNCSTSSSK